MPSYSDWRLPNKNELASLVHLGQGNPAAWLNSQGFSGVKAVAGGYYWSSTTTGPDSSRAFIVYMYDGSLNFDLKTVSRYAFAARDGQSGTLGIPKTGQTISYAAGDDGDLQRGTSWPNPRFVDNMDGTVTDNLTGFVWEKNPSGTSSITWAQALAYADVLVLAGYSDWRLPNRNELLSLTNAGQSDTASWLIGQGFLGIMSSYYWPSTTFTSSTVYAWGVGMVFGDALNITQAPGCYVLAVRGGQ